MKKELLALCMIAVLPGCGCWRKDKTKAPKKSVMTEEGSAAKTATPKKAKTHMDMQKSF